MKTTYSITEAQARLPGLVREAVEVPITITRHDQPVAYLISRRRMEAISETLELLADPKATAAVQAARDGSMTYTPLHDLDED